LFVVWRRHGRQALQQLCREDPASYLRLIASLVGSKPAKPRKSDAPIAALICPYLKRIDAHVSPSLDEVAEMLVNVATKLSMISPKRDAAE
jgi:hypothetical protein